MNLLKPLHRQQGVALVFSLLLLLVLTIIGVAAMNSTVMQERMAGNLRMQTQVFEVASEGVGRALDFYYTNADAVDAAIGHEDGLMCGFVHSGVEGTSEVSDTLAWRFPAEDEFAEPIFTEDGMRLEQRMYCCRSWAQVVVDGEEVDIENPSKLFVLSRGTFLTGDEENEVSLARREVEVKLDEADPGNPTCALCIPGQVDSFNAGKAKAMQFHGGCGPAITTETQDDAGTVIGGITDSRMGNYDGGVTHGDMGRPWNDPNALAEFAWWVKLGLEEGDTNDPIDGGYFTGDQDFGGNTRIGCQRDDNQCTPVSDYGDPVISYFDGDLDMAGTAGGHGLMIVLGELEWGGTPNYDGLIVALGSRFDVAGGGGGGNKGSMVVSALEIADTDLEIDSGDDLATALGNSTPLPYRVAADDDGFVKMYDPDEDEELIDFDVVTVDDVPPRPVLRAWDSDAGTYRQVVHFLDAGLNRFFNLDDGREMVVGTDGQEIRLCLPGDHVMCVPGDPPGGERWVLNPQPDLPRDKFGRLIPNFVDLPGLPDNWPHDAIEYSPNRWGWGWCGSDDEPEFCDTPPFSFGRSDFDWDGGGGSAYTYDCRWLQRTRHRLLCTDQAQLVDGGTDAFPPDDYDYDDPDYSLVCRHHEWATEYNEDVLDLASELHNHHAWHLWDPKCECLGITTESDMILSGWRENLGWRDDDFAACAGLPEPVN